MLEHLLVFAAGYKSGLATFKSSGVILLIQPLFGLLTTSGPQLMSVETTGDKLRTVSNCDFTVLMWQCRKDLGFQDLLYS